MFQDLLGKGIYVKFSTDNGNKELVGILVEYTEPLLLISSRGRKQTINQSFIIEIREALGEVEP